LEVGDEVRVHQTLDNTKSQFSPSEMVQSQEGAFPNGIPAPRIEPVTVYECAIVAAVLYEVPGLELEISVNGNVLSAIHTTYAGYRTIDGFSPLNIGDELAAKVIVCNDESPWSEKVVALQVPRTTPPATIDPNTIFEGQTNLSIKKLTYGTFTKVENITGVRMTCSVRIPMAFLQ